MIERAFERARLHKDNKRNALRQFAIDQARRILKAAGVVDPTITDHAVAIEPQIAVEHPFYRIPEGEGVEFIQNIGGKSPKQLEAEVEATGRKVTIYASDMLHSPTFEVLEEVTPQKLLEVSVRAFGLPGNPTTRELLEKIPLCRYGEYALELPRAEVGPHMAIADKDQVKDNDYCAMHKPITDRHGGSDVFEVGHDSHGRFLDGEWADPGHEWDPASQLVVALRKIKPVKP